MINYVHLFTEGIVGLQIVIFSLKPTLNIQQAQKPLVHVYNHDANNTLKEIEFPIAPQERGSNLQSLQYYVLACLPKDQRTSSKDSKPP